MEKFLLSLRAQIARQALTGMLGDKNYQKGVEDGIDMTLRVILKQEIKPSLPH